MKKIAALLATIAMTTWAFSAQAAPLDAFKGQKGTIDIAGGTAHVPVMKKAAQAIMAANGDIRITVTGGGSGAGVKKVGEGLVNIGNTGRALKPEEVKKYGLVTFPFAIDGVAVAVNPKNPVSNLSRQQVKDIFAGKLTNWKQVGGADAPINVYIREDGSGTRETFEEKALDKGPSRSDASVLNSNGAMKTGIARDPNAIGYVGIGHIDASIKGVSFEGKAPTQGNAASGSYPVTRLLYMNTKGEPEGLTRLFIDYIFSTDGKAAIEASGYIPVRKQ